METLESPEAAAANQRAYARPPGAAGGRRARQTFMCEHCGRQFVAKPVHDHRGISPRRFCSKRCTGAHRTAAANAPKASEPASRSIQRREGGVAELPAELINMSLVQALTPAQAAKVRGYVFGLLRAQIPFAHKVVMGELEWTPTQARVFATLLDKCLPNLSASFVESERRNGDLCFMTREELEALVAGGTAGEDTG